MTALLNSDQLWTILSLVITTSFIGGWLAHRILDYSGFGVYGNWLILMVGCGIGVFLFTYLGYHFRKDFFLILLVCFGSAAAALIVMLMIKRIFKI